jgi:hypothetical protein
LSRHNTNILAHVRSALRGKDIESALKIATRGSSAMLDTLTDTELDALRAAGRCIRNR